MALHSSETNYSDLYAAKLIMLESSPKNIGSIVGGSLSSMNAGGSFVCLRQSFFLMSYLYPLMQFNGLGSLAISVSSASSIVLS